MTQAAATDAAPGARRAGGRSARQRARQVAASELPVARIAVDVPLPHLDRLFDYLVPQRLSESAVRGSRVRVRFAGRLTGGFVTERAADTEHHGRLSFIERVVSPEPVLTEEIAGLARAVADRYGGTLADVLRLAIPPRHAAAESEPHGPEPPQPVRSAGPTVVKPPAGKAYPWDRYLAGTAYLAALAGGRSPRAVWSALPGLAWPDEIARAVAAATASGRGALVVVPDARDLDVVDAAMTALLGPSAHVSLSAQLGPAERYRRWLTVLRGERRIVTGTRSAMFAPVADLGLVVLWDEGNDLHAEPRAPYPHARDVLLLRAYRCRAAALVGGFARTAEAAQLVATGWAKELAADRQTVREFAPMVAAAGEDDELGRDEAARTARMPSLALRTVRAALDSGPVLFQVPRRGYLAAVACRGCGMRVRCAECAGPVALAGPHQPLRCLWCGSGAAGQACPACGGTGIRALVTGERRTAEELGRAFPGVSVRTSSGPHVVAAVPGSAAIVIATPGAEPRAAGGYAAAILLDGWSLLARPGLRAGEEALRRWMNAAALVRPGSAGGKVIIMADPGLPAVQALIRWDGRTHAGRELAEREDLRLPPAVRMAALTGAAEDIAQLLSAVSLPQHADVLGPVPAEQDGPAVRAADTVRYLVRAPSADGTALALALRAGLAERSAAKSQGQVRLQLDPAELI